MGEDEDSSRLARAAGTFQVWLRALLAIFWALVFISWLVSGEWALAGLALIFGSLSGFWLTTALETRRNGRPTP